MFMCYCVTSITIQQNVTLLLCYCMLQRYLVTILPTLLYGMVLPCNCVTTVTVSYCTKLLVLQYGIVLLCYGAPNVSNVTNVTLLLIYKYCYLA